MSGIVVDLGCERHGTDNSIGPLVERFKPEVLLGFDPAATPLCYQIEDTEVVISTHAAWVNDGTTQFSGAGDEATIVQSSSAWNGTERPVRCFDFSAWLRRLTSPKVIVKMDIEGAELPILEKVVADGTDDRISLLIIEWHDGMFDPSYGGRRTEVEAALRCPAEIWP